MLASPDIDSLKTLVGNSNNNDLISNNWSLIFTNKRTPGLSHFWNSWLLSHITNLSLQLINCCLTLEDSCFYSHRESLLGPRSDCWTSDSSNHDASNHGTSNFQQVKQASVSLKICSSKLCEFLPLLVFTCNITQIKNKQLSGNFPFLISVIKATNINSKLRDFKHFFWKQNMQHLIS